jgi:hypothetical protein
VEFQNLQKVRTHRLSTLTFVRTFSQFTIYIHDKDVAGETASDLFTPFYADTPGGERFLQALNGRFLCFAPITDYPKVWPQSTKSLATQEKIGESALQASSRSLAEVRLIPAKFQHFCYSYSSTGQFTYVAKLLVGNGQTFG